MTAAEDRYLAKVAIAGPDKCWLWTGSTTSKGYGQFDHESAHRWGYKNFVGPIPDGMCVCHQCDVPACQNPSHWFLGTVADNNRDRDRKGRTVVPDNSGERHGLAKLTVDEVKKIRFIYASGEIGQRALAGEFGISQTEISRIIRGVVWSVAL